MRNLIYAFAGLCIIVLLLIATLCILSPFDNRFACQFQVALYDWTGIGGIHMWPSEADDEYTGVVRIWDKWGTLRTENAYFNGTRHGVWKQYDENGALRSTCEYKNGRPWNGVCQICEGKAWKAEYRNGKPFNGCVWENDANGNSIDFCFVDGQQVSVAEFMARHKIEEEARDWLSLADIFTDSQLKMQLGPKTSGNVGK
jgi:hypothetical protein